MDRRHAAALALVVLVACGSSGDEAGGTVAPVTSDQPPPVPTTSAAPQPGGSAVTPPSESSAPSVRLNDEQQAIADLARRNGVDPSAITTVSVQNVTWRDSSLGCPQQGMRYLQVLSDGVRVVLELDGKRYEYHSGRGRPPFYCPNPQKPVGE